VRTAPRGLWKAEEVTSHLTKDDYDSIDRAEDELQRRGWRRFSLNGAVDDWGSFVRTVEESYDMCIDDYTNDLSVRRWAAEARPLLTGRIRVSLDQRLAPIDERFRTATFEAPRHLPGAGTDGWWETRLPRRLVGELAEDVTALGLRFPE
jgi:hypothetical protein